MAAGRYRDNLDGVRAICIVFTVFNHVRGMPRFLNGSVGVDVFFALSGWLITWLLLKDRDEEGIDLKSFYVRRWFRIAPLLFAAAIVFTLVSIGMDVANKVPGPPGAGYRLDLYLITFNGEYRTETHPLLGQAWTLGIEEKFYILWPALLLAFRRRPWWGFLLAAMGSVALMALSGFNQELVRGYSGLAFGTAMAIGVRQFDTLRRWVSRPNMVNVCAVLLGVIYVALIVWRQSFFWNLLISMTAAVMIAGLWNESADLVSRALSTQPLPWLGRLTYALYLFHTLATNLVEKALPKLHLPASPWLVLVGGYILAVGISWVAHKAIEQPLIDVGKRLAALINAKRRAAAIPAMVRVLAED